MKNKPSPKPDYIVLRTCTISNKIFKWGSMTGRSKPQIPGLEKKQKGGFVKYVLRIKKRRKFTGQ